MEGVLPDMLPQTEAKARILIVDDNLLVRRHLRELLASRPGWEVCGEASDGSEAVGRAKELAPDIVVMDLAMPLMNGLRATHQISLLLPTLPIVMFSMYASAHFSEAARQAGARAAVSKSEPHEIIEAVEALLSGKTFFRRADTPARGRPSTIGRNL